MTDETNTVENHAEWLKQLHLALSGTWLEIHDRKPTYHDFDRCFINTLWSASKGGHKKLVQFLSHFPLNNHHRELGFAVAAFEGHVGFLKILLKCDSEFRIPATCAPIAAAFNNHVEVIQLLIEYGASLDGCSNHRYNLYQEWSGAGSLCDFGGFRHGDFDTALQAAATRGEETIVKLLLEAGVDVNNKIGRYGTALTIASRGGHEDVVRMLIQSGADVNIQGGVHQNALYAASLLGWENVVQILLDNGADPNVVSGNNVTALYVASGRGHENVVRILLSKGADPNVVSGNDVTALYAASSSGWEKVVQILLDNGADINFVCDRRGTAIWAALGWKQENIVQLLRKRGADPGVK